MNAAASTAVSSERGKGRTVYVRANRARRTLNEQVGGFGAETNEQVLYHTFSSFGDIVELHIPPDTSKHTDGAHRGFGYIEFAEATDAQAAVDNMHLNEINGRTLKVNMSKPIRTQETAGSKALWNIEPQANQAGEADSIEIDE